MQKGEKDSWLSQQSPGMQSVMNHIIDMNRQFIRPGIPVSSESPPTVLAMYAIFH